jgi:hypothetical protein
VAFVGIYALYAAGAQYRPGHCPRGAVGDAHPRGTQIPNLRSGSCDLVMGAEPSGDSHMFTFTSNFARIGALALGMVTCLGSPAMTAPLGRIVVAAPPASSNLPVELASDRTLWRVPHGGAWRGGGNWNGNHGWRGNGNWGGNRHWHGGHWNHGHDHYHNYYDNSGIVLGLGGLALALPLLGGGGYYGGGYYPGRYYRAGNGHERWCYARYRSYRASDNTFQPNHGARRQCYSPD